MSDAKAGDLLFVTGDGRYEARSPYLVLGIRDDGAVAVLYTNTTDLDSALGYAVRPGGFRMESVERGHRRSDVLVARFESENQPAPWKRRELADAPRDLPRVAPGTAEVVDEWSNLRWRSDGRNIEAVWTFDVSDGGLHDAAVVRIFAGGTPLRLYAHVAECGGISGRTEPGEADFRWVQLGPS